MNLTKKLISAHLVSGKMIAGEEIAIKIDQTLTQDSTGTMAYLQLEAIGIDKVKTQKSIAYIDHNTLQTGFENADDHLYITSAALKYGVFVSRPGNGICHQVHLERFAKPSLTLLGSDSHTPTAGGMGMLAIGAGGLDVAAAMGGAPFYLNMPKVVNVRLIGSLNKNVSAKDIILQVLRLLTVKGGVGKVVEYTGEGLKSLSVPERATIANMGAELGATTSVFPSDQKTKEFLAAQNRLEDFVELKADDDATYDEQIVVDLSKIKPLAAMPHSPDNVLEVAKIGKIKVDQVCIGSCTNSSYADLMKAAAILKGKTIAPNVSLTVSPGSRQVLNLLIRNGALADLAGAGARILECACGPCIGMGQSPKTDAVSVRTFNRNFYARSGTKSAQVYLTSCETAAYTALNGYLSDPSELEQTTVDMPQSFLPDDNLILDPCDYPTVEIVRGPNIKPFPRGQRLEKRLEGKVLINLGDNITTDDIMPSNSKLLPYRSNIPYLSDFCLNPVDEQFSQRAKEAKGGFIVAGENYGQGSSREHAALVPLYLRVKAVLAISFARIHKDNLINNGILPLEFVDKAQKSLFDQDDKLVVEDIKAQLEGGGQIVVKNITKNKEAAFLLKATDRQLGYLLAGGLLNSLSQK